METISRRSALAASASGALLAAATGAPAQPATTAAAATPDAPSMKSLQDLIEAARANAPGLAELLNRHLPGLQLGGAAAVPLTDTAPMGDTTTVGTIASGNVVAVWGQDFLFAVASDKPATISIDRQAPVAMTRVAGTELLVPPGDVADRRHAPVHPFFGRTRCRGQRCRRLHPG